MASATFRPAIDRLWYSPAFPWRLARLALAPLEGLFRIGVRLRDALYARGVWPASEPPAPAISIGNLTVGGTGKTPLAAWIAERLLASGARPAIVSRGYGGDELLVHQTLVPRAIVAAAPDRRHAAADAVARGADVLVLDDAFQHRRLARSADIVLIAAERDGVPVRLLPAGPYREGPGALRRASLIVVTRKRATLEQAEHAAGRASRWAPSVPIAVASFALEEIRTADTWRPIAELSGRTVLAIAGIADPASFAAQLEATGASVELAPFPDHHAFTDDEVADLARRAREHERVVGTLKDFVKLAPRWPADAPPLWYASQGVHIERGGEALDALIATVLARRNRDLQPDRPPPAAQR